MNDKFKINKFLEQLNFRLSILEKFIEYQNKFFKKMENYFEQEANDFGEKQVRELKEKYKDYIPSNKQQEKIQKNNDELHKIKGIKDQVLMQKLLVESDFLSQGYSEMYTRMQAINNYYEYSDYRFLFTFKQQQNDAILLLIYAYFEHSLKQLCIELNHNNLIFLKQYTKKSKEYLIKYCKVNSNVFKTKYWNFLNIIRKLRNHITHNNSEVKSINPLTKKEIEMLTKFEGIEISSDNNNKENKYFINLSDSFLLKVIDSIRKFYTSITITN